MVQVSAKAITGWWHLLHFHTSVHTNKVKRQDVFSAYKFIPKDVLIFLTKQLSLHLKCISIKLAYFCFSFQVYKSDVIDALCSFMDSEKTSVKSVIILIPVRLGGERTNMEYLEFVKV